MTPFLKLCLLLALFLAVLIVAVVVNNRQHRRERLRRQVAARFKPGVYKRPGSPKHFLVRGDGTVIDRDTYRDVTDMVVLGYLLEDGQAVEPMVRRHAGSGDSWRTPVASCSSGGWSSGADFGGSSSFGDGGSSCASAGGCGD